MTELEKSALLEKISAYCEKFNVPLEFLFHILEDQKVTPMIRGKAMEYSAYLLLKDILPSDAWSVEKLNLNAQPGAHDEDISVTHRRTGIRLKVESKSTVRGSFKSGARSRKAGVPHFNVKSHRSRSNIKLAGSSNDRYSVDSFDVLITNTSNAAFQGNTVGEFLEAIHDAKVKEILFRFYGVDNDIDLLKACSQDWRFCIPTDIGEKGFIPRTPLVLLADDPNWHPIRDIEARLLLVVEAKKKHRGRKS